MVNDNKLREDYLIKVNKIYSKKENQSLTDILNTFNQLPSSYRELENNKVNKFSYSSYNFSECTKDEQLDFYNDQLQLLECFVTNSIYEKGSNGIILNWGDIYKLIINKDYAKTDKINRKVVWSTSYNQRPVGDNSYMMWNGLLIIDLDIKNEKIANSLKPLLFEDLKKYNWFLGITLSSSKKSLHVWTKIRPISITYENRKTEFLCNFRHKYSYIYIILSKYKNNLQYTDDDMIKYLDMSMERPTQGIFIPSDSKSIINMNFQDLRLDVNFESAFSCGIESIDWITHPDLKNLFRKLEWFNTDRSTDDIQVQNISGIDDRDPKKSLGKRHYKHAQRWQLANTLTSIYGYDAALQLMKEICKGTPTKELAGDVKTASIHNKPISTWAIKELNSQHGFNLKIKSEDLYKTEIKVLEEKIKNLNDDDDPIKVLNSNSEKVTLHLSNNQYLSDIQDQIIENLSHITLLEAGAGYGKTEMIKSLKAKTILVLPFTSTIKAKVEADEKTANWLYYYGNKRPTLEEILGPQNMSMTIDKFSKLNVMELNQSNYEYIVIDESHLLFTSSYRDVMGPTIQRLANCKAKVIMMTGTPTGELLFFPGIKHIKVIKEDFRQKEFEIHMVPTKHEKMIEICKSIAKDIVDGKKILWPTNRGNLAYEQITGIIQEYLNLYKWPNKLKPFYYKKSNYGDNTMENINTKKSIGDRDIIFCSTYLSVGVDICDKYNFSVYFNEPWIAQDIEQFANRLRNNDLYIKLFLEKEDSTGFPIDYYHIHPLDLSISQKELLLARDMIRTCNDMIERNQEESKYNPLIQSLLSANRYLKYDENDCKYYIDETTYKLQVFEERYSDYSKQLNVMINNMKYYGYHITKIDSDERIPEDKLEWLEEYLKSVRHIRYDWFTKQTFIFLNHLNDGNIDIYKELVKGDYTIFKDDKYSEKRNENNIYAESIEILEKNIPIVLSLYKFYDCPTIIEIYKQCLDNKQNKINYAKLNKIRKFIQIENNRKKKRIDFPIYKFLVDAKKFVEANHETTNEIVHKWVANYAAKYANSIKDVVVDDLQYFEDLYELTHNLFDIITVHTRPKNGKINLQMFELLWEPKNDLNNIYGGIDATKQFFTDLIGKMKPEDQLEMSSEEIPDLPYTSKLQLNDVEEELPNVIHKEFNYYDYSKLDESNDRFMRKQQNTNKLSNNIFIESDMINESDTTIENNNIIQGTLNFEEAPF